MPWMPRRVEAVLERMVFMGGMMGDGTKEIKEIFCNLARWLEGVSACMGGRGCGRVEGY